MSSPQTFTITPSWKLYFLQYASMLLLVPAFGLGLLGAYFIWRNHRRMQYRITDSTITRVDDKFEHNMDLADIKETNIEQTWLDRTLGIAALTLQSAHSTMALPGLTNASQLKAMIDQAAESERQRLQQRQEAQKRESGHRAGDMDKLEYLTGLWQQGLITNAEYEAQRNALN